MPPTSSNKIYFVTALSSVPLSDRLHNGVPVMQVAANGKTQSADFAVSPDKFTIYIRARENKGLLSSVFGLKREQVRAVDIGEIDRIQRGQSTQQFEKAKKNADYIRKAELGRVSSAGASVGGSTAAIQNLDPRRSFSIIFRGAHTLDLMAETVEERSQICDALDRLLLVYQRGKIRVAKDVLLLRYVWLDVIGKEKTEFANVSQMGKILQQINLYMTHRDLQTAFDKFGKVIGLDRSKRRRGLTFEQSATFLHKLKRDSWLVKPVTVIWNELFGEIMNNGSPRKTVSDKTFLEKFLKTTQGNAQATIVDVRKLFRRLHDMETAHTTTESTDWTRINKDQFEAYLLAAENDAFDPENELYQESDMNHPISEYFINSSHNTYLLGDQLTSVSSVEMYSNALYRGARCLELDIWDGERTSDGTPVPVVWHGHTMTTKIRYVDILKTIKVFLNFHPDTFPIVLSFENHCSIPYQEVMAEQLVRILGASLYVPKEESLGGNLPSPNELRGMVLVKGRRPDDEEADAAEDTDEDSDDGAVASIGPLLSTDEASKNASLTHGISPELARVTLFHGTKHKSWDESTEMPTHYMHSFSENKVRIKCKHNASYQWIVFNQTHMSRTYPAGSRVDSSNYNPLLAWSLGCQMAALNFQTQDAFLRLNDGRFRENGNCGYVLKPSVLMTKEDVSRPQAPVRLSVRVLTGSCLPKAKGLRTGDCIDPYVKVSVFDVKNHEKEAITSFPTSVVPANGFSPIWSAEKFVFNVENWAVAMLQLTVYDKAKEEFIASSSIPISCLRRGIRSVKLYDATNTRSGAFDFASLLLDIKIGQQQKTGQQQQQQQQQHVAEI